MNIGLTGGIACGKSTVSAMLAGRGAALVDADRIAREVVEPGSPVLNRVASRFGQAVLLQDGSLDRKALGRIVFGDEAARKELEALLHPPIRALMRERMEAFEREQPHRLVVVDVPLLFESGLASMFEEVLLVYVPREVQLERLIRRDGLEPAEALKRLEAQLPIDAKRELADNIIDNSGTVEETERQVALFWQRKGLP
ncbi:dephospho-CoA kinase [Paenibacillus athensensis]|uniref:Dephospho-CoA kinase n=1 Tax=Paenibacillus athensensis TaxID=1967502 RepID=A0A4Y8QA17_9BACL|nr:dephospho-CoA kinase [Paenibacillus athensensis]MCD1258953.1 dephospho-CoA kinase [Paenibacillus athensensis]